MNGHLTLLPVKMAGLVIYLMDFCNWKNDAVCRYQQSNGDQLFDKGHLDDMKIHKVCASHYLCKMYEQWEGHIVANLEAYCTQQPGPIDQLYR